MLRAFNMDTDETLKYTVIICTGWQNKNGILCDFLTFFYLKLFTKRLFLLINLLS